MHSINITGITTSDAKKRAEILQEIDKQLSTAELEKLGKIAQSQTAKNYLKAPKYMMLKNFLKL